MSRDELHEAFDRIDSIKHTATHDTTTMVEVHLDALIDLLAFVADDPALDSVEDDDRIGETITELAYQAHRAHEGVE